eukprot:SAG22_NODE_25_length_30107_cov_28.456412_10_plen_144_part_00
MRAAARAEDGCDAYIGTIEHFDWCMQAVDELWSYCPTEQQWTLRWTTRFPLRQFPRAAVGPRPTRDNAALLPWLAGGEQMLLLYNPDCNSGYSPDADGDIGGYWPHIPLDLRDMPWVYVVRTGVWQRYAWLRAAPRLHRITIA